MRLGGRQLRQLREAADLTQFALEAVVPPIGISATFQVSESVIDKRIQKDGLWKAQ